MPVSEKDQEKNKGSKKAGESFSCSACVSEGLKGIVAPAVPSHWDLGQIRCVPLPPGPAWRETQGSHKQRRSMAFMCLGIEYLYLATSRALVSGRETLCF